MVKVVQINLNHAKRAQDMLVHRMMQESIDVAVISEPYRAGGLGLWFSSEGGSCALLVASSDRMSSVALADRGQDYVAVYYGRYLLVSSYFSPNRSDAEFEAYLDGLAEVMRHDLSTNGRVVLAGDFNARSSCWRDSVTSHRGVLLERWMDSMGLIVMNTNGCFTCERPNGSSIIDLTFISSEVSRHGIRWKVNSRIDSLSDHFYLDWALGDHRPCRRVPSRTQKGWNLRTVDPDKFRQGWERFSPLYLLPAEAPADVQAESLMGLIGDVCDASMSRHRPHYRRKAYWWTPEIARLRTESNSARRKHTRARGKRVPPDNLVEITARYRERKRRLQDAIVDSQRRCWQELLDSIDRDPWGRPYKMVMARIRSREPIAPIDYLSVAGIKDIMSLLFPDSPPVHWRQIPLPLGEVIPPIEEDELSNFITKSCSRNAAPGFDGISAGIIRCFASVDRGRILNCLNACLSEGRFPSAWKQAKLVLIRKPGKQDNSPSSFRPICLLDDMGKILERVIAGRINQHLRLMTREGLSRDQYGFRVGRSTCDALLRVRGLVSGYTSEGQYCAAISLDIRNAFNTVPWHHIVNALCDKGIPIYLINIIKDYFTDRLVVAVKRDGTRVPHRMSRGVPQGSVLGPLLWNVAYDAVLGVGVPSGVHVVCFADDTLLLVASRLREALKSKADLACRVIVSKIENLGLEVSGQKSEVVVFGPRGGIAAPLRVSIGSVDVEARDSMRYLGIILDRDWRFVPHFEMAVGKAERMLSALCSLMPNLRGPRQAKRALYASVVHSVLLYGAPFWAGDLTSAGSILRDVRRVQRRIATRVVCAYRTVSWVASLLLAGIPPFELLARSRQRSYLWLADYESRTRERAPERVRAELRRETRRNMIEEWLTQLNQLFPDDAGAWTRGLIVPNFREWVNREHGFLTFRLTQLLSGHGVFSTYLHRINRFDSNRCEHCVDVLEDDNADHTLARCENWAPFRERAELVLGEPLTAGTMVPLMLASREGWDAVAAFAEAVMGMKEEAERLRQGQH